MTKYLLFTFTLFLFFCFPCYSEGQPTGPPFSCNAGFYQYFGGTGEITVYNPVSELFEPLGGVQPENYNAFGYNIEDDYLYGINNATENLYSIDSNGDATLLGTVLGLSSFNAGDFDDNGNMFVQNTSAGVTDVLYIIDVSATPPIAPTALTLSIDIGNLADIVFDPVSGLFYGVSSAPILYSINPTTGAVTSTPVTGILTSGGFGGAFADRDGKLYFFNNNNGRIYEVNPTTGLATLTYSSSPSASNDAASCPLACAPVTGAVPTVTFCDVTNTPYTFTVDNSGVIVNNPKYLWTGPNGFTSTDLAPNFTAADASASGEYCIVTYDDADADDILDPTECVSDPICITLNFSNDIDGDLVGDFCDLDNDNDGILDVEECNESFVPAIFTFTDDGDLDGNESGTITTASGASGTWNITHNLAGGGGILLNGGLGTDGELFFEYNHDPGVPGLDWTLNDATLSFNIVAPNLQFALYGYANADASISNPSLGSRFSQYTISWLGGTGDAILYDPASQTDTADGTIMMNGGSFTQPIALDNNTLEWYVVFPIGATSFSINAIDGNTKEAFRFSGVEFLCQDTDSDGIANYLDLDSDNDGCPDAIEGSSLLDWTDLAGDNSLGIIVDADGVPTTATGGQTNVSSTDDSVQAANCDLCTNSNHPDHVPTDSDNDLIIDICDLDDDNDGILDDEECNESFVPATFTFMDDGNLDGNESGTITTASGASGTWNITHDFATGGGILLNGGLGTDGELFFEYNHDPGVPGLGWTLNDATLSFNIVAPNLQFALYGYANADASISNPSLGSKFSQYTVSWGGGTGDAVLYDPANQTNTADGTNLVNGGSFTQSIVLDNNTLQWYVVFPIGATSFSINAIGGNTKEAFRFSGVEFLCQDTDGDGIANYLDLDSDNDGCPDAIEGDGAFLDTDLESVASTSPLETTINGVDANGIPNLAAGGQGAGTNAYDEAVLDAGCIDPLPVELLYFKGTIVSNGSLLEWLTTAEINNDYFSVQRSFDGIEFDEIGIVYGNGNISSEIKYDFLDRNPKKGINYYRLEQFDFDGTSEYSHTIALKHGSTNDFDVYPNPIRDLLNIDFNSSVNGQLEIRIIDVLGRVVHEMEINSIIGNNNIQLPVSNFVEGVYELVLKEKSSNETSVKKFLKIDK